MEIVYSALSVTLSLSYDINSSCILRNFIRAWGSDGIVLYCRAGRSAGLQAQPGVIPSENFGDASAIMKRPKPIGECKGPKFQHSIFPHHLVPNLKNTGVNGPL